MQDDLVAFRAEVRDFVRDRLPPDIAEKVRRGREMEKDDYVRWQKILREKGWFAAGWKKEHGGQGWSQARQLAFLQASGAAGAPMLIPYGVNMVGPVLNTFGTEAQRARHIPGILSNDVWWCQGYSEPGAGSDLASLKTRAVREGDFYRVNGTKMWTTEAHWADWMHCLVRTDDSGKPQEGISFLLIDMTSPGITLQPIVTIDGQHHTNQTFLDDVMVPVENLVGTENRGWDIAKFLLGHERISIADTGPKMRLMEQIEAQAAELRADTALPARLRTRLDAELTGLRADLDALVSLENYLVRAWDQGRPVGADGSILKIRGTEVLQAMSEFAVQLQGLYAGAHDPADLHAPLQVPDTPATRASAMAHHYLYGRAWSIFGGTNEVQRQIIAKTVL
ncbi:MAG: acyl-CoA dehydrogenase family protein [Sagittula sp.]|uniref:acyl-CoA dehydrogenase family protein n=1 Tax=Sagittula sp. TaxID=2038081 RepID=UPI00405845B3